MADVHQSARKKKPTGNNKAYYYSLTYDEEDSGSVDTGGDADELQRRVANILAETDHIQDTATGGASGPEPEIADGRLDFNDNLFGGDGAVFRNSRSLDFDMSDDDEFQSIDSRSDVGRPEMETASIEDDFVQITRPVAVDTRRRGKPEEPDAAMNDDAAIASGSGSEHSPRTSGLQKQTGSSPLAVVYVKQKPSLELYDGNFIDDDILQPQDDRVITDDFSQDLLPMPVEEMTLEMDEEDDGIPDTGSAIDADPIMFRKSSSQRWFVRHRKLVIVVAVLAGLVAVGGLAAILYFAIAYTR